MADQDRIPLRHLKKPPVVPLVWGGALLAGLLLVLALAVLISGGEVEQQALLIQSDSVPGLIDGHAIRSAYSEEFTCLIQAIGTGTGARRDAFLKRLADLDAAAKTASDDYRKTIHIDPVQDTANLQRLLRARDDFMGVRAAFLVGFPTWSREQAQEVFVRQLTPSYDALRQACDVLMAYNDRTGTVVSAALLASVAKLRWTVAGVVALALIGGINFAVNLLRMRRVQTALRESEQKFSAAFQLSPLSMLISRRADGRVIEANEAFRRRNELGTRDPRGKSVVELGIWASVAERDAFMRRVSADGRARNVMTERVLPNGRKATSLISSEIITVGDEEALLSVSLDVTELLNAQDALARSAAQLSAIFEGAAIGIALSDPTGGIVRSNPAIERLLGYSREELGRLNFAQFVHPEDVAVAQREYSRLVAGEQSLYRIEQRYLRKNGETIWGHVTVSAVRRPDGRLVYGVGMVEDVTEHRRSALALHESETARQTLEDQLIVAQRLEAVGQLAGGVAHDFNNMLAAIMLYVDLLKADPVVLAAAGDSLDELTKASRRAAGLTRQLLLFSRREPAQRQAVDLTVIVANLVKMLERLVGEHLQLVQAGPPHALWLHADPGMVEQVIMNLVVNARDAMPQGGEIVLRSEVVEVDAARAARHPAGQMGRFVRLSVIDAGCGMSAEVQAHIFEPFFTTKEAGKGTGLGLSTVFGIAQQHGGWVEVDSMEGKGSSFAVYFPAHTGPVPVPQAEAKGAAAPSGRETVLLAEDNEPVRVVTAKILRKHGYHVIEAADGREADALLAEHAGQVDLLLTDVIMPGGLLGHELVAGLPPERRPRKVILMSGHNTLVDRDALDRVASAYLSKPFDTDRLLRTVRATLDDRPLPA